MVISFSLWFIVACTKEESTVTAQLGTPEDWMFTASKVSAQASSFYEEGVLSYEGYQVSDGNPKSAWCSERNDTTPWVQIYASCTQDLKGLLFRNGFAESKRAFSQRKRVRKMNIELFTDEQKRFQGIVLLEDTLQEQHIDFDYPCTSSYLLTIRVLGHYPANGPICLSEAQPMVHAGSPEITRYDDTLSRECVAKDTLFFYAGPSNTFNQLGVSPILMTTYGAPYVRVVEEQGQWARIDRIRRRVAPKEKSPQIDEPKWGGWVEKSLLDCVEAFD